MQHDPDSQSHTLFEGEHIRLRQAGRWQYAERPKASGVVAVLAFTNADELILVEQFRVPVGKRVVELPAGLAGDLEGAAHEELAAAATRELLEETGYEASSMELLTEGPPSAGMITEIVAIFRARGLKKVAEGGGDASEEIEVHLVPRAGIDAWLDARRRRGSLIDPKIYAALYFA